MGSRTSENIVILISKPWQSQTVEIYTDNAAGQRPQLTLLECLCLLLISPFKPVSLKGEYVFQD